MTAQTLEDILITDKEIEGYMATRDTGEHLKIKRPSEYLDDVEKYFLRRFNWWFRITI